MTQDIEQIILNKTYAELTDMEREAIREWITSEAEFNTFQSILKTAPEVDEDIVPPAELKAGLIADFDKHHAQKATTIENGQTDGEKKRVIGLYVRIAWTIAALFLLGLFMYPFMQNDQVLEESKNPPLAKQEVGETDDASTPEHEKLAQLEDQPLTSSGKNKKLESTGNLAESSQESLKENAPLLEADQIDANGIDARDEVAFSLSASEPALTLSVPDASTTRATPQRSTEEINADVFVHADILDKKDVLKANRQIVADKPAVLDLLYTSF